MPGTPELEQYQTRGDIDYCPTHRCEYTIVTGDVVYDCPLHRMDAERLERMRRARQAHLSGARPIHSPPTQEEQILQSLLLLERLFRIGIALIILMALLLLLLMSLENARITSIANDLPAAAR